MKANSLIFNINSANPDALRAFYVETVGLELEPNSGTFPVGNSLFAVDGHSEVAGPSKEPGRALFSFQVDDLAVETNRLKAAGVECIRESGEEYWGGKFSTFIDPDGNYFQFVQFPAGA